MDPIRTSILDPSAKFTEFIYLRNSFEYHNLESYFFIYVQKLSKRSAFFLVNCIDVKKNNIVGWVGVAKKGLDDMKTPSEALMIFTSISKLSSPKKNERKFM